MLFTTAIFAFLFLPSVVLGFFLVARISVGLGAFWLFAASVFFYGYWMPAFVALLLASICANFLIGRNISLNNAAIGTKRIAKLWLIAGVILNLGLLAYFKYTNFFLDTLRVISGADIHALRIVLPIGISFYTFTQIAFLADAYQKGVSEYKFIHYGLFVTYFPHLIAGPVLHHAQMMPQFKDKQTYLFRFDNFTAGMCIFCIGLAKKIVIADGISPYADAIFNAEAGASIQFNEAWLGSLAYTFQLYFDFSGYSDMAIGLSWMLNVRLPFNFNSPYQARNIIDFWRRWHITLSVFLRDYLYIALGGNRRSVARRYVNLALTMLLGGLWHGASWTFVFWGGLHGVYLCINHAIGAATKSIHSQLAASSVFQALSWMTTFLAVVVAWVFFRATSFDGAVNILAAMFDPASFSAAPEMNPHLWNTGLHLGTGFLLCGILGAMALFASNSNAIGETIHRRCTQSRRFCAICFGASLVLAVFLIVLNEARDSVSAFIYFNF